MDLNKLTTGDKVIGISGILLFVFSFFSWLGAKVELKGVGAEASGNAWDFTLTTFAVLLGIALVVLIALKAFGVELPTLGSVTWGQIVLGVAGLIALLILIKLIAGPNIDTGGFGGVDVSKTRKIGIFLGFLASLGLVAGAYLNFQGEKSSA